MQKNETLLSGIGDFYESNCIVWVQMVHQNHSPSRVFTPAFWVNQYDIYITA